jgi:regulator of PEP synthase PpsR (kinase-PPPase family)
VIRGVVYNTKVEDIVPYFLAPFFFFLLLHQSRASKLRQHRWGRRENKRRDTYMSHEQIYTASTSHSGVILDYNLVIISETDRCI